MNHAEALQSQCAERYLLGEMSPEERLDFEDHYFDCRECADDVKAAVAFTDNARALIREGEGDLFGPLPPKAEVGAPVYAQGGALIPFLPRRLQPPPALLAAAVLLLFSGMVFQNVVVIPDLQNRLAAAQSPQAVSWQFLTVSRSATPVVELSSDHSWVGLRLSRSSEQAFPFYRCELRDASDRVVQSAVVPAAPEGEELSLILPASRLKSGEYALVLSGLESRSGPTSAPEISRYAVELEIDENGG